MDSGYVQYVTELGDLKNILAQMKIEDIIVLQLDEQLHHMIREDMITGNMWEMDDETLDLALTSMWEDGVDEWKNQGVVIGEA
jgi:hypothetical protein|tara:strand:+ start:216 stop:464 length:249 start_codon:yes stop_codon:yes gene_type:complete